MLPGLATGHQSFSIRSRQGLRQTGRARPERKKKTKHQWRWRLWRDSKQRSLSQPPPSWFPHALDDLPPLPLFPLGGFCFSTSPPRPQCARVWYCQLTRKAGGAVKCVSVERALESWNSGREWAQLRRSLMHSYAATAQPASLSLDTVFSLNGALPAAAST